jgi:2-hydroxychromene-2-carboxylate isomerase
MKEAIGLGASPLTVLLDLRHPLAALALHPTLALFPADDVDWLPLVVPTLNPPSLPTDAFDRGVRHRRFRAEAIAREIETYSAAQGLVLRDWYRSAPADAANLGWLWIRSRHRDRLTPFLVQLFRAYWEFALDASDAGEVAALIEDVGADGSAFRTWSNDEGPRAAASVAGALRERGLFQVPAYLVGEDIFYGRQHLPMIRWILAGRVGPGPI